ncbi:MAG: MFS transporter [Phycisphaerales bacterium JB040]
MPLGPKPDNPPKHYFGWTMLAVACLTTVATSPGQTYIAGTLFAPEFEAPRDQGGLGLSTTAVSTAYLIATCASAALLTLVGKASDRFGPRRVIAFISAGLALACAYMGLVQGFVTLMLGFFLLRFLGQGSLGVISGHTVALWFERRLGTVEAIRHGSMSLAVVLLPVPVAALINAYGWRWAYPILGVVVALLTLPAILLIFRNKPEDAGQQLDGHAPMSPRAWGRLATCGCIGLGVALMVLIWVNYGWNWWHLFWPALATVIGLVAGPRVRETAERRERERDGQDEPASPPDDPAFTLRQAVRTTAFWAIAGVGVLNGLVGTAIIFHMAGMVQGGGVFEGEPEEVKSMSRTMAAAVMAPWAIASGLATPLGGVLVDRIRPRYLLASSPPLLALSTALALLGYWLGIGSLFYLGMGVFGLSQACAMSASGPTIARWFGRAHHGSIRGFTSTLGVAGTACGPIVLGVSSDYAGGFSPGLILFIVGAIPLTLTVWSIDRPTPPGHSREPGDDGDAPDDEGGLGPELIDASARMHAVDQARARTKDSGGPPVRYELDDTSESIPLVGDEPDEPGAGAEKNPGTPDATASDDDADDSIPLEGSDDDPDSQGDRLS